MKNLLILFSTIIVMACIACGGGGSDASLLGDAALTSELDSMCYAVGASFSKSMKENKVGLDGDKVCKGYLESLEGASYINEENAREITAIAQKELSKRRGGAPVDGEGMDPDSLSYAIGSTYYLQLKSMGMEINHKALAKGIRDYLQAEGTGLLDEAQMRSMLDRFGQVAQKAQMEKRTIDAALNKEKGAIFLAEKSKEEGVKSTPSGLMYKVVKEGTGKSPTAADKVLAHYEGRLIDGKVFDSSIQRGEPIEFSLGGVIKGWTEGLQLMKTGAKYQFYIPADLAYGDRGSGQDIGPGATLIFDVELLEVK